MEQQTVTIKIFLRIIYPDIHLRRMAYPQERRFRKFVQDVFETDLTTLFTSKESEEYKINQIDNWWNSYKKQGR